MSDAPEYEDNMGHSLREWIEINITKFLTQLPYEGNDKWNMPVIEDFVLIVAAKDYKDGAVGVFTITHPDSTMYRVRGLISSAFS